MTTPDYRRPTPDFDWPRLLLQSSTASDPNGILVSATDNGGGSFTIGVDGSAAHSDPAAGYSRFWPLVDPAGQALGSAVYGPMMAALSVSTAPANESDLVVLAGFTEGASLGTGYVSAGLHYDGAAGAELYNDVSGTGTSGSPIANAAGARMTLQMRANTVASPPVRLARGFAEMNTAAGLRLDDDVMSVANVLDSDQSLHFFIAVFTSTATATTTSVTFTPSYLIGPRPSGVLP